MADIVERCRIMGVTGTADQGLPLHLRFQRHVDTVIGNGVECEPVQESDRAVLTRYTRNVLEGLTKALEATDARRAILAIRQGDAEVEKALEPHRRSFAHIEIARVVDGYPNGEARQLLSRLLGLTYPPGAHPEDAGVMVINVHTLWHLQQAQDGRPPTHRFVTVAGWVQRPQTLRIPIGTAFADIVTLCGGLKPVRTEASGTQTVPVLLAGSPLRGRIVQPEEPLGSTVGTLIALPPDHPHIRQKQVSLETALTRAASTCGSCRICTEMCPPRQLGLPIEPHRLMRAVVHRQADELELVRGATLCSGCSLCEAVCPAGLSPRAFYQAIALELQIRTFPGVPVNPGAVNQQALEHSVSRKQLGLRLGLESWSGPFPIDDNYPAVNRIMLPIQGGHAEVREGEKVRVGDRVISSRNEAPGHRSVPRFSPIDGRVHVANESMVEIRTH